MAQNEQHYKDIREAVRTWTNSTLIAYFGNLSGKLALDPMNREIIAEHRIIGDEIQRRMD